jgi:hypothetical protein
MDKTCVPFYISIEGPSTLTLYCETCHSNIDSWDGKSPTLDQLNETADQHCAQQHSTGQQLANQRAAQTQSTMAKTYEQQAARMNSPQPRPED